MQRVVFPFRLNVGTDIVHLPRIQRLISKREGSSLIQFAKRILHPLELRDLSHRCPRWQEQREMSRIPSDSITKWLGGRFAAKEAARKAICATKLGWKDVRVEIREGSGEPQIIWTIQRPNCKDIEHEAKLSISHDGDYVVATVLAARVADVASRDQQQMVIDTKDGTGI